MDFEKSIDRLKEIIDLLENGKTSLSESLELYKEAVELSVNCKQELENARTQVTSSEIK
ncbi:MAG: exodeoxyribonuclease VII small subunit [Ruminococcus sp.]|nr:exodeoxyribonuclease VII small subunit [Ruminococcus sp.]